MKVELNPRQAKYIKNVAINGMSKRKAAKDAGYSPCTNSAMIENSPKMKNALAEALNKRGLSEAYLSKKLMQGVNAYDKHFFSHHGQIVSTAKTPDFQTREKYVRTVLEVQGYLKNSTIDNLNIGLIQVPGIGQTLNDANEWNESINEGQELTPIPEQPL